MASLGSPPLVSAVITFSKSVQIACITIFFYTSLLNLNEEKEFIWARKWSLGKVLFLLSRYTGAVFFLAVCVVEAPTPWLYFSLGQDEDTLDSFRKSCLSGFLYTALGVVPMLLAKIVMMVRVYALHKRSRRILILLCLLTLISVTFASIQAPVLNKHDTSHSSPCLGPCDGSFTSNLRVCSYQSLSVPYIGWLWLSVVELIFFGLVMWSYREAKNIRRTAGSIADTTVAFVIVRESVYYFTITFTVFIIGLILTTIPSFLPFTTTTEETRLFLLSQQGNPYETFVVTIMSVLAPKLLLDLRKEYSPTDEQIEMSPFTRPRSYSNRDRSNSVDKKLSWPRNTSMP